MKIKIDFEGLNKIFCKFGIHRWHRDWYPPMIKGERAYGKNVYKFCLDCGWEKYK